MLIKYFKTLFILFCVFIVVSIAVNYSKIYKQNLSTIKKIAILYEALLDVKSDMISLTNFTYKKKNNQIKKIYLDIEPSALEKSKFNITDINEYKNLFNNNIEKKYFKASLRFKKTDIPTNIKFRMRGKNKWHHRLEKPSLRLKLKKDNPYNLMRHINLTSPEGRSTIENYYPDHLSNKIGLVAHYGEMIELIINNQSFGIYHLHSREDESLIRINRRMPGPILVGQYLQEIWNIDDFKIINMESISNNQDIFKRMIEVINVDKKNLQWREISNIWGILSYNQFAKFFALNSLMSNVHNDYKHNHEFYFDPTKGKIEPIISDALCCGTLLYPRGRDRVSLKTFFNNERPYYETSVNQKTNPILNILLLDPTFYDLRIKFINKYLNEFSPKKQRKILEEIYKDIDDTVYKDNFKSYIIGAIGGWRFSKYSNFEYNQAKENLFLFNLERNKFLTERLKVNELRLRHLNLIEYPNKNFLKVEYKGHRSLILDSKIFPNTIKILDPSTGKLIKKKTKDIKIYTGLKIIRTKDKFVNIKQGNDIFHNHEYSPDFQTYIFEIENDIPNNVFFEKLFLDSINVKNIENIKWFDKEESSAKTITYNRHSLHIWKKKVNKITKIILGPGEIELKKNLIIDQEQELKILPNTKILIWPNISIFAKGKVNADGENGQIELKRKFEDKHWGNFSINGSKTNGSILKKIDISGGSFSNIHNISSSGMLSISWNKDITLSDIKISNNSLGDDTLHFSNSSGDISNLEISNCYGDCIDFDYSKYSLNNLVIEDSVNDGIDFMESNIEGTNIEISNSLDKGLSVGEASKIKLNNLTISNSNIGIAVKDKSKININNIKLLNNLVGVDIYKKNWRYGKEGEIYFENYEFVSNQVDISTIDLKSIKFKPRNIKVSIK